MKRIYTYTILYAMVLILTPEIWTQVKNPGTLIEADIDHILTPTYIGTSKANPTKRKSTVSDLTRRISPTARQSSFQEITFNGFTEADSLAFQYAVDILQSTIPFDIPLRIEATWDSLGYDPNSNTNIAGQAGPATSYSSSNFQFPNSFYPVTLANKLTGIDNNPGGQHIYVTLNSEFPQWYFGTDANPGADQLDFVTVILHELGHGLGILGGTDSIGTSIYVNFLNTKPLVWSNFIELNNGTSILSYPHNSPGLTAALTSDDLYFNGPFAIATYGSRPKIYAPNPFQNGFSYYHLDPIAESPLWEPVVDPGEAKHSITDLEIAMLYDLGWTPSPGTAIPGQLCNQDTTIYLSDFLSDESVGGTWTVNAGGLTPTAGFDASAGTFITEGNPSGTYIFDYTFPLGISSTITLEIFSTSSGTALPTRYAPTTHTISINLISQLDSPDPGGVWTVNSNGLIPSSGFIDASGEFIPAGNLPGSYLFDYTVSHPICADEVTTVEIVLGDIPFNDICDNAELISCLRNTSGSTRFATFDSADDIELIGVWYKYIGNNNLITISTCSGNTNFDVDMTLFGGSCQNLGFLRYGNFDSSCSADITYPTLQFFAELDKEYFIWLTPLFGFNTTGDFELSVSSSIPCVDSDLDGVDDSFDPCPNNKDVALDFTGGNNVEDGDYVEVPHHPTLNFIDGDFTIEAWIYSTGTGHRTIISKGNGFGTTVTPYVFGIWDQAVFPGLGRLGLYLSGDWQFGNTVIPQNQWMHVAVSFDYNSKTATFYLNGLTDGQYMYNSANTVFSNDDENPMFISRQGFDNNVHNFTGKLDEIAIWDKALTAEEIIASIAGPYSGSEDELIVYYDFNDADPCVENNNNTILRDRVFDQNGTLVNFALSDACKSNWVAGHNIGVGPDTDGDGVFDCVDECPNNPDKTVVGACGCSDDADNDNVCDEIDMCPDNRDVALSFEKGQTPNTSDYVVVDYNSAFDLTDGDFAFEAWVNPSSGGYRTIVSKGLGVDSLTSYVFQIIADDDTLFNQPGKLGLFLTGSDTTERQFSNTSIEQNTWTHVAVSVDNSDTTSVASFYVNGALDGVRSYGIGNLFYQDFSPFFIGRQGFGGQCNHFDGLMDDLAVWDATLTVEDITASMQTPYTGTESDLVAYYNFNQGSACEDNRANITLDDINGPYDGTLVNFDRLASNCVSNWTTGKSMGDCLPAECLDSLNLSGNNVVNTYYKAAHIHSTQMISSSAIVDYNGGEGVNLLAGFEVESGSTFHAFMDQCAVATPEELFQAGYNVLDLLDLDYSLLDLYNSGIDIQEFFDEGFTLQNLIDAEISIINLILDGIDESDLIGLNHAGGIIFFINNSNGSGLVATHADQSDAASWACLGIDLPGANNTAIGTGAQNTTDILTAECSSTDDAANICTDLMLNDYDDWFLPSIDELEEIYLKIGQGAMGANNNIGGFTIDSYWSSSESSADESQVVYFGNGDRLILGKEISVSVRAIRAF